MLIVEEYGLDGPLLFLLGERAYEIDDLEGFFSFGLGV